MIQEYENLLRTIISNVLGSADETDFKVTAERIDKWKDKREIEKKKFDGILTETRILYYSDFYDLNVIISKNREIFKAIFDDKKRFEIFFNEIEAYRNTIAHGRQLLPYQQHILEGIVGDLKTKLVLHHNKNVNTDDYFIKLLKISDNLGNVWDSNSLRMGLMTETTLRVGDSIELLIEAYDPKERDIMFEVKCGDTILTGQTNSFSFPVNKSMIGKLSIIRIKVSTEAEYNNEEGVTFVYSILP